MTDDATPENPASSSSPPWIENFEIDHGRTPERALSVVDWARANFSRKRYDGSVRNLQFHWLPQRRFEAYASIDPRQPDEHIISFTEWLPRAIVRDSVSLATLCEAHFTHAHYDVLFSHEIYDYGQGRENVLPPGIDRENAADQMFRLTLAWLYLHEQAHHFQGHLLLEGAGARRMLREDNKLSISESQAYGQVRNLSPEEAAISHVTELAADAEATGMALQLIMVANDGLFSRASLWLLIAGLMCLFQRFHGSSDDAEPGEMPVGSHPRPAFRMRMALEQVMWFAMHPRVREHAPWITGPDVVQKLVDHASTTASIFWTIRSLESRIGRLPPFYRQALAVDPIPEAHSRMLLDAWLGIRDHVEAHYFGWYDQLPFDPKTLKELS